MNRYITLPSARNFELPLQAEFVFPDWKAPPVPEITIDEYNHAPADKNEIRCTWKSSIVVGPLYPAIRKSIGK
jgi:hypothetical protein